MTLPSYINSRTQRFDEGPVWRGWSAELSIPPPAEPCWLPQNCYFAKASGARHDYGQEFGACATGSSQLEPSFRPGPSKA
jgi:hypothetical protein